MKKIYILFILIFAGCSVCEEPITCWQCLFQKYQYMKPTGELKYYTWYKDTCGIERSQAELYQLWASELKGGIFDSVRVDVRCEKK